MLSKSELLDLPNELLPQITAKLNHSPARVNLKRTCKFFYEMIQKSDVDIHKEIKATINNYYKAKISGSSIDIASFVLCLLACEKFELSFIIKPALVGLFIKLFTFLTEDYSPAIPLVNGKSYSTISELVTAKTTIEMILKEKNELQDTNDEHLIDEPLVDDFIWICP